MRAPDLVRFTSRSVLSQRLRASLTALGIAVGVAAVVLLTSIGEGVRRFVVAEFTQFGTNIVSVTPGTARTMHFDRARLEEEAPTGFALATDIAEWLVKNGVPFRHAHELSGACVKLAEGRGQELWDLTDNDFIETFAAFLPADKAPGVRVVLSSLGSVDSRNGKCGAAYARVR